MVLVVFIPFVYVSSESKDCWSLLSRKSENTEDETRLEPAAATRYCPHQNYRVKSMPSSTRSRCAVSKPVVVHLLRYVLILFSYPRTRCLCAHSHGKNIHVMTLIASLREHETPDEKLNSRRVSSVKWLPASSNHHLRGSSSILCS